MRSAPHGRGSPQLAIPARPPHRCLCASTRAVARLSSSRAKANGSEPPGKPPGKLGYRMPAEWEPHEATWLAWPHERTDWPGKFAPIPWVYADIVRHLARVERVRILAQNARCRARSPPHLAEERRRSWRRGFFLSLPPIAGGRAISGPSLCKDVPPKTIAESPPQSGASTPGQSTTTGRKTMPP